MSEQSQREETEKKRAVYALPGMDRVTVRSLPYQTVDGGSATMDVYQPRPARRKRDDLTPRRRGPAEAGV
jgi:hypothetical protein